MEIDGLPLHPLVVHAAVVLIPLVAVLTIVLAVLPGWRWLSRWPAAVGSVVVTGIAFLATRTGRQLEASRPQLRVLVQVHAQRGDRLAHLTEVLAFIVLAAAFLLPGPSGLASGRGARPSRLAIADKALPVLLVVVAVAVLVQCYLTGESGARAVWG